MDSQWAKKMRVPVRPLSCTCLITNKYETMDETNGRQLGGDSQRYHGSHKDMDVL